MTISISEATNLFLAELRRSGYSPRTIAAYQFDLERFIRFLNGAPADNDSEKPSPSIDSIDAGVVKRWMDDQLQKNNSSRTMSRKLSSLKALYKFLLKENLVSISPLEKISAPKFRRQPPKSLSQEEVRQLLQAPSHDSPLYLRDRAIIHLLYSTGIRVSELVSLTQEGANFEQQIIRIRGKGSKDRIVPLMDATRSILLDYALDREKQFPKSNDPRLPFFLKSEKKPLTVRMIQYMLEQHGQRAAVRSHVHPHLLRHSIATHLVEEGASLEAVRQTLGHEDLSTTSIYLKTSKKFLFSEHKKFNPSDKLLQNTPLQNNNTADS